MSSRSRPLLFLVSMTILVAPAAQALDATCQTFVDAADLSAHQAARQSVMEAAGNMRMESIVADDILYSRINGKWVKVRSGFWAMERKLVTDMRSGAIKLSGCRTVGHESIDGINTTAIEYTMTIPGNDPDTSTVYIGQDGLIYAQSSTELKVRYRYAGVRAPQL